MRKTLVVLCIVLAAACMPHVQTPAAPFYFAQVAPGLYESEQPRSQAEVDALGLKPPCTLWRLSNDGEGGVSFADESRWAHTAGCAFIVEKRVTYPLVDSDGLRATASDIEHVRFRGTEIDFHCKRGIDRTQNEAAAWRLLYTNMSRAEVFHLMNLRRTDVDRALDLESTMALAEIARSVGK